MYVDLQCANNENHFIAQWRKLVTAWHHNSDLNGHFIKFHQPTCWIIIIKPPIIEYQLQHRYVPCNYHYNRNYKVVYWRMAFSLLQALIPVARFACRICKTRGDLRVEEEEEPTFSWRRRARAWKFSPPLHLHTPPVHYINDVFKFPVRRLQRLPRTTVGPQEFHTWVGSLWTVAGKFLQRRTLRWIIAGLLAYLTSRPKGATLTCLQPGLPSAITHCRGGYSKVKHDRTVVSRVAFVHPIIGSMRWSWVVLQLT